MILCETFVNLAQANHLPENLATHKEKLHSSEIYISRQPEAKYLKFVKVY